MAGLHPVFRVRAGLSEGNRLAPLALNDLVIGRPLKVVFAVFVLSAQVVRADDSVGSLPGTLDARDGELFVICLVERLGSGARSEVERPLELIDKH